MKPIKRLIRRIIFLVLLAALALGALSYAGCIGCTQEPLDSRMELDGISMAYPADWGEPANLDGTTFLGLTVPSAVGIQNSMTTVAAVANISSLHVTPDMLGALLSDYDIEIEPTAIDGYDAIELSGTALFVHVRAIGTVENGQISRVALVTCNAIEEKANAAQYQAMIDSVRVS